MMRDYKNSRVTEHRTFGAATIAAIVAIVALLGWMGERDREHTAEIEFQRQVINGFVAICPVGYDNSPTLEMSMPIGSLEL